LIWEKPEYDVAWQQFALDVDISQGLAPHQAGGGALAVRASGDAVNISGMNFSATFSRAAGTLTSLKFGGRELLATNLAGRTLALQLFRAPTDNDKGFGKWLARDWREAGLSNLVRTVDSFQITNTKPGEIKIYTVATSRTADGGYKLKTLWTVRGDGSLEMENKFAPFGNLPLLPRVGIVMALAKDFENVRWLGRGPWENYPDRKESADMGVWNSTAANLYVPYVRPQDCGNREDTRWLQLMDAGGSGLKISAEEKPFSFSALHFTADDLASVRHNYELKPRDEIFLSLDAKMSGLGNSSCGPGVLEKFSVPPTNYFLHLKFSPVNPAVHSN
jgi:beta-galactosidase